MNVGKLRNKGSSQKSGKSGRTCVTRQLTREVIKEFSRLVPQVFFLETVAACLNINRTTWRKWLSRGREEAERLAKSSDAQEKASEVLYLEFYYTYRQALARGKTNLLKIVGEAALRQWQAAAWLLERRFPEEWGLDKGEIKDIRNKIKELEAIQVQKKQDELPVAKVSGMGDSYKLRSGDLN